MYEDLSGMGFSPAQIAQARFYTYTVDFTTTVAAGGTSDQSQRVDDDWFIVDTLTLAAFIPSASGGASAFTGLAESASPTIGSNTFPGYESLRVMLRDDRADWFKTPVRASALFGTGREPYYPLRKIRVNPGGTIYATLYNDSGQSIRAQVVFAGVRLPK